MSFVYFFFSFAYHGTVAFLPLIGQKVSLRSSTAAPTTVPTVIPILMLSLYSFQHRRVLRTCFFFFYLFMHLNVLLTPRASSHFPEASALRNESVLPMASLLRRVTLCKNDVAFQCCAEKKNPRRSSAAQSSPRLTKA